VRILVDYRPALRARTGVGEYIHHLVRAYARDTVDEVAVFTSSWKDRPAAGLSADLHARVVDRRVPGALLNACWHRLEWPPVERLTGPFDVVHAAHPLLIPSTGAAQVVTIHDLDFLAHPDRTQREIRRDYPVLAGAHARRAHAVVTSTYHGRQLVIDTFGVPGERVYTCRAGAPVWHDLGRTAHVPPDGYVLFLGTLEPRKNIGTLLDAWEAVLLRMPGRQLVLAGQATPDADAWLARMARAPLAGSVRHLGYVEDAQREQLFKGARVLVLPSLDEGFGLTALEAMSAGVPVVAASRGSLPEVVGEAGVLVDPTDARAIADALVRVLSDRDWAIALADKGLDQARAFTWQEAAATLRQAYRDAVTRRQAEGAARARRD
jgi:glycosyltransferase involved in cell wall biosynthesis